MLTENKPTSFTYRNSHGELGSRASSFVHRATHGGNAALIFDQIVSGTAVFPAYVLRRAGLLDSMNESLTRVRE
jgi:hypothetical protein